MEAARIDMTSATTRQSMRDLHLLQGIGDWCPSSLFSQPGTKQYQHRRNEDADADEPVSEESSSEFSPSSTDSSDQHINANRKRTRAQPAREVAVLPMKTPGRTTPPKITASSKRQPFGWNSAPQYSTLAEDAIHGDRMPGTYPYSKVCPMPSLKTARLEADMEGSRGITKRIAMIEKGFEPHL
jgi:hypothetical protein